MKKGCFGITFLCLLLSLSACSPVESNGSSGSFTLPQETADVAYDDGEVYQDKTITTATLSLTAFDFEEALEHAPLKARALGGYVERYTLGRTVERERPVRNALFCLRIPSEAYEPMKAYLYELGEITGFSDYAYDAGDAHRDFNARLDLKMAELNRLMELREKAGEMSDIIAIEARISELMPEIVSMEEALADLENRVSYMVLELSVKEDVSVLLVPIGEKLPEKMKNAVVDSVQALGTGVEEILVLLCFILLPGCIFGGMVLIVRFVYRKTGGKG